MGERRYTNRDALKHHAESEAFKAFQQEVVPFLESPPVIRRAVGFWGFENRNSANM
jgi:quinol monooxygenase YgiN